jgi:hypothetical protein
LPSQATAYQLTSGAPEGARCSYPITALELENKVLMIVPAPTITAVAITA